MGAIICKREPRHAEAGDSEDHVSNVLASLVIVFEARAVMGTRGAR